MAGKRGKKRKKRKKPKRRRRELNLEDLAPLLDRAKAALQPDDYETITAVFETLTFVTQELESKRTSVSRLRKLLFGASTEKTSRVFGKTTGDKPGKDPSRANGGALDKPKKPDAKRPGHGRNGVAAYTGANKVKVPHPSLDTGDGCPACAKGRVYPLSDPSTLVRIIGMAPLAATVYACDRLRCNLCGDVFTAKAPKGVGDAKYDATASAMVGLLKYGCGLPFNRIEKLQQGMGIPLPASTQWDLVRDAAELLEPAHDELINQAAQGKVIHSDDTTVENLELMAETKEQATTGDGKQKRTGVYTSGIVSLSAGHKIALFFSGRQHAGENLADVLAKRAAKLPPPIQMSDALSANTASDLNLDTILANCNAHARRRFVEVADNFPEECRNVLETLREVYKNDAFTRKKEMSATQRMLYHKAESGPLMKSLKLWMKQHLDDHLVESNSGLGEAMKYMRKHWSKLTLFLRKAGAPLDNNIVERALKKAILHRKNALFYKTLNGAHVGDTFMSLIHTAELNKVEPFNYLVALQRNSTDVVAHPADWMPWNYQDALEHLRPSTDPPP